MLIKDKSLDADLDPNPIHGLSEGLNKVSWKKYSTISLCNPHTRPSVCLLNVPQQKTVVEVKRTITAMKPKFFWIPKALTKDRSFYMSVNHIALLTIMLASATLKSLSLWGAQYALNKAVLMPSELSWVLILSEVLQQKAYKSFSGKATESSTMITGK